MLHAKHPSVDLRLSEAEPPEALRMLRAGYVDIALIFRHEPETERAAETETEPDGGGLNELVLLDEPVHLIAPAAAPARGEPLLAPAVSEVWPGDLSRLAGQRWIAGCDRCREHLLRQCAAAGFTPKIAFTTDDFVAVQALVTAGLGIALLPGLALRAALNPGIRTVRLRGTRRSVIAVRYGEPPDPPATALLLEVLRAAAAEAPLSRIPERAVASALASRYFATWRPNRCIGFSTR
jgi:DNA-binding transcriptional LysR family regulator